MVMSKANRRARGMISGTYAGARSSGGPARNGGGLLPMAFDFQLRVQVRICPVVRDAQGPDKLPANGITRRGQRHVYAMTSSSADSPPVSTYNSHICADRGRARDLQ